MSHLHNLVDSAGHNNINKQTHTRRSQFARVVEKVAMYVEIIKFVKLLAKVPKRVTGDEQTNSETNTIVIRHSQPHSQPSELSRSYVKTQLYETDSPKHYPAQKTRSVLILSGNRNAVQ